MKLSALALSNGLPRRLHRSDQSVIGKQLAIVRRGRTCDPRSVWQMHPGGGRREAIAALSAATASRASMVRPIA